MTFEDILERAALRQCRVYLSLYAKPIQAMLSQLPADIRQDAEALIEKIKGR